MEEFQFNKIFLKYITNLDTISQNNLVNDFINRLPKVYSDHCYVYDDNADSNTILKHRNASEYIIHMIRVDDHYLKYYYYLKYRRPYIYFLSDTVEDVINIEYKNKHNEYFKRKCIIIYDFSNHINKEDENIKIYTDEIIKLCENHGAIILNSIDDCIKYLNSDKSDWSNYRSPVHNSKIKIGLINISPFYSIWDKDGK